MKIIYSIFWLLEGLNILLWLVMGAVSVLFMDNPNAKLSDLWYIPTIILILIIIEVASILITTRPNASWVKYAVIIGFILSMIGSFPSFLKIGELMNTYKISDTGSTIAKTHLRDNAPLSPKEEADYFTFLLQDGPTEKNLADFNTLLDKHIIDQNIDFNGEKVLNKVVSLKPTFLDAFLKHKPIITNNSSLVLALYFDSDVSPEAANESMNKLKMLLKYGLNPNTKDWQFNSTLQKSSIEAMEYQVTLLEKAVEKDTTLKQEYAKEKGKDPSQIEDDISFKKERESLKNAQEILNILKGN